MEFKYAKGSKTLEAIKAQNEYEENNRRELFRKARLEYMETHGFFHTAQEMIDFVLGGGKIVADDEYSTMELVDGKIKHFHMFYNDIDEPLGYGYTDKTIEEFIEWAKRCEQYQKEDGAKFVNEYFHKDLSEEEYV